MNYMFIDRYEYFTCHLRQCLYLSRDSAFTYCEKTSNLLKEKKWNACRISNPILAMTKCANRKLAFYKRNQTESCVIAILSWRLTQMHYECAFTIWASAWDFQQFGMCDQQSLRPACAYAQSDQSLCLSLEYSMIVKLLTERHLEFLSLKVLWTFKNIFGTLHNLNDNDEKTKMLKTPSKNSYWVKSYASFKIMQISI